MSTPPTASPTDRLRGNLVALDARIEAARRRGAHAAETIERIVVTKSQPPAIFGPLRAAGVTAVGENRVAGAAHRRAGAPEGLVWHGIGHLQRNKAAAALEVFDVFHALDSLRLARRLEDLLAAAGRTWPVHVQINAAEDPAKGGWRPDEAGRALEDLAGLPHLLPIGFMTMATLSAQESDLRRTFSTLRGVRDEAVRRGVGTTAPTGLSMGMSNDFEIAVEEGATAVRIGRAVFAGVSMSDDTVSPIPEGGDTSPDGREPS